MKERIIFISDLLIVRRYSNVIIILLRLQNDTIRSTLRCYGVTVDTVAFCRSRKIYYCVH